MLTQDYPAGIPADCFVGSFFIFIISPFLSSPYYLVLGSDCQTVIPEAMDHPYYPPTVAIPHYVPNTTPVIRLLVMFGGIVGVVVMAAFYSVRVGKGGSRQADRFAAAWFALCMYLVFFSYPIFLSASLPLSIDQINTRGQG